MVKSVLLLALFTLNAFSQTQLAAQAEKFLGAPYDATGPLGEGSQGRYDQDPLFRLDAFDCTTFVETVIALSTTANHERFMQKLKNVRYRDGQVDYLFRNHIISLDWIPNNKRAGHVWEASNEFPQRFYKLAYGKFDMGGWLSYHTIERLKLPRLGPYEKESRLEELKSHAQNYSKQTVTLEYLEIDLLLKNWEEFKDSASGDYVLSIVRPNWNLSHLIGTNLHISHQGILSKQKETLFFVHASAAGEVVKVDLKDYLSRYQEHTTIKGIHLLRVAP